MTFRELPTADWHRLVADGIEPFATHGLPDPEHWRLVVAEDGGRIVACSSLVETVHNDWFVRPEVQRNPVLVAGLWLATKRVLDDHQVSLIHATVSDYQPDVQAMVERFGYIPAEATLYVLRVDQAVLNSRG